jgi:serine/threonine protein phosphatase PrpC
MGQVLTYPILSQALLRASGPGTSAGCASLQGYRQTMEDRHVMVTALPRHPDIGLYGVFDGACGRRRRAARAPSDLDASPGAGHGGDEAAIYLESRLKEVVNELKDPMSREQLTEAMLKIDAEFMTKGEEISSHGSTCVFAVVKNVGTPTNGPWKVICANAGDSRCVLVRANGTVVPLSHDHKPNNPEERERIMKAGGNTNMDRVDGQLALSR